MTPLLLLVLSGYGAFIAWAMWRCWTPRHRRTCWVFCPCGHDLNGDDASFVCDMDAGVVYSCARCGRITRWLFDAPAPIRLE